MDEFESDTQSLLEFIDTKCNDIEEADPKKLVIMYSKCIRIAIVNVYSEQNSIYYSTACANLISNIFKIIYSYSYNLKLALFICERSTLLFNEYLNISKNYSSDKINLLDVKQFIINKSIGPIINKNPENNLINTVNRLLDLIKSTLFKLMNKKIKEETKLSYNLSDFLEIILDILINSLTNIYSLGYINYIEKLIEEVIEYPLDKFPKEINLLKIKLELFLYCYNKLNINYNRSREIVSKTIQKNKDFLDNIDNIDEFFDAEPLADKYFFKKLKSYINKLV